MVLASGLVKITDFGIARLPTGDAHVHRQHRRLAQVHVARAGGGERASTARSDIFSLGAVLYEVLTGTPPFAGADARRDHPART